MDDISKAIERIKLGSELSIRYYKQPISVCYSGGKDSEVIVDLSIKSKVPIIIQHSHTTVDAPEPVRHVRDSFKKWELQGQKVKIDYPENSFWAMLGIKTTPPTRLVRWCCETQKEAANKNKVILTGVRWDESTKRSKNRGIVESNAKNKENRIILMNDNDDKRQLIDKCMTLNLTTVNPIIDWDKQLRDDYISDNCIKCNPLYSCGFNRVGCVGCCLTSKKQKEKEFEYFPAFKNLYLKGFDRMYKLRESRQKAGLSDYKMQFTCGQDIFDFYMQENQIFGQERFF